MKNILLAALMILATTFVAPAAEAFWLPPTLTPAIPKSGESVSVVVSGGGCDYLIEEAGYPQITRNGQNIRILVRTEHQTFGEFCTAEPFSFPFSLGTFVPGNYSVQVDIYFYSDVLGNHAETLAILPMSVAAAAVPAPIDTAGTLISLAVLLAIVVYRKRSLITKHEGFKWVRPDVVQCNCSVSMFVSMVVRPRRVKSIRTHS